MQTPFYLLKKLWLVSLLLTMTATINAQSFNLVAQNYTPGMCAPAKIKFKVTGNSQDPITEYSWNINYKDWYNTTTDTLVYTFDKAGHFWVTVEIFSGNTWIGSAYTEISLSGLDINIYSSSDSVCVGSEVDFSMWPSPGGNFMWDFGDPISGALNTSYNEYARHSFNQEGTYLVKLFAPSTCGLDSVVKSIYVSNTAKPSAQFWKNGSSEACPGDPVKFNPQNWNAKSYLWNFGDPASGKENTSTKEEGIHMFTSAGKYAVSLTVTNECGQSSTYIDSVDIINNLDFSNYWDLYIYHNQGESSIFGCPGDVFEFYSQVSAKTMLWSFGNGDSSEVAEPIYLWNKIGEYDVTLTLINGCGNDTTITEVAHIGQGDFYGGYPQAGSQGYGCPGDPIGFGTSENNAASYLWDFGDGSKASSAEPRHAFTTTGVKTVSVKITNNCGNDTTLTTEVIISDTITPDLGEMWGISLESACIGDTVLIYTMGGASYTIDFGDGFVTSETMKFQSPMGLMDIAAHAYAASGTYTIKLIYYNNCGKADTGKAQVIVGTGQAVNGDLGIMEDGDMLYTCQEINFVGMGGIEYTWDFGDGTTLTTGQGIIKHAYDVAGTYDISLTVTNGCGNTATYTDVLNIMEIPSPVVYQKEDTLVTKLAMNYQWYKDGIAITTNGDKDYVVITSSGNYTVKITDFNGCTAVSEPYVSCFVDAGQDVSICLGAKAQLSASGASNYAWSNIGTLTNAAIANPLASPIVQTTYIVTGTSTGCTATDAVVVKLAYALTADAGNDKAICKGESTVLDGFGGGSYAWSNATTLSSAAVATPVATPTTTSTYVLTVTSGSCTDTDAMVVTVYSPIKPSIVKKNDTLIAPIAVGYQWYQNGKPMIDAINASIKVYTSGNYAVEIEDANGCTIVSDEVNVTLTAINEGVTVTPNQSIKLYPNPVKQFLTIEQANKNIYSVSLYSIGGQQILHKEMLQNQIEQIDMSQLSKGIYIIKLVTDKRAEVHKIIKD